MWPEHESDLSSPTWAEVKNAWSLYALIGATPYIWQQSFGYHRRNIGSVSVSHT